MSAFSKLTIAETFNYVSKSNRYPNRRLFRIKYLLTALCEVEQG